jgi:hypothetical protein
MKTLILSLLLLFSAVVEAGQATLTWTPPTRNTNGTALTNLAGYDLQYRKKGVVAWTTIKIANPGARTRTIYGLTRATWQFRMKSYNNVGVRSLPTGIVSKFIAS